MPRRSDEHLAMRREQILTAALRCFAREGFHATTMADVIRESGMSAGAVYRYFPSKNSLIVAGAGGVLERARDVLAVVLAKPDAVAPDEALRQLLHEVLQFAVRDDLDLTRVGVSAWAEALRDPELMVLASAFYASLRADLTSVVGRWRDAGHLPDDTDVTAVGQALFSAIPGFLLQRLILGDVEVDRYCDGLQTLVRGATAARTRTVDDD